MPLNAREGCSGAEQAVVSSKPRRSPWISGACHIDSLSEGIGSHHYEAGVELRSNSLQAIANAGRTETCAAKANDGVTLHDDGNIDSARPEATDTHLESQIHGIQ